MANIVISIDELVKPISAENPVGINLRHDMSIDSPYRHLKELRARVRAQERDAEADEQKISNTGEDWQKIIDLCLQIIREQTKDLEVTAWLIEGLTRLQGFAGLATGFQLLGGLIENFWPEIYPAEDEDGVATKLAPLTGLNGERSNGSLIIPINCIPLFYYQSQPLMAWQYQQALTERDETTLTESEVTLKTFEEAVRTAGWEKINEQQTLIKSSIDEYEKLCTLLDAKCGRENSPPCSNIRNALLFCMEIMQTLGKLVTPPFSPEEIPEAENNSAVLTTANSRQQAFQTLKQIADFFHKTEPNSPVPYLLEQAIRWGNMPLPALLTEIITDDQILRHSYQLLGVRDEK